MSKDTTLHELCKGFGAILSRSKSRSLVDQASILNERGNLPLHTACSHKAPADVIETLLKACPSAASQANANGNLPLHQAAMWQAPLDSVEVLITRHPDAATVRNQYGSLPLHLAASNHSPPEVVSLLIKTYPDALQLQNDDGMTPLDLALSEEDTTSPIVLALLQNRPLPPEKTKLQQAEELRVKGNALERHLLNLRNTSSRHSQDMVDALSAVRRLADRFPHALYCAGVDPNELEIAISQQMDQDDVHPDGIILEAVQKRAIHKRSNGVIPPEDRVEELLGTVVGLDHIKSQVILPSQY